MVGSTAGQAKGGLHEGVRGHRVLGLRASGLGLRA